MPANAPYTADTRHFVPQFDLVESAKYSNWLTGSNFLVVKYGLINVKEELARISELPDNWDSYGAEAPARRAIEQTRSTLAELAGNLLLPSTIVPSAAGGVSAYFMKNDTVAYIESYNDGTQTLVTYDRDGNTEVLEVGSEILPAQLADQITGYLG